MTADASPGEGHVIQSLGGVTVEFKDASGERKTHVYNTVEVLNSGWLRCLSPDYSDDSKGPGISADYFPPHKVHMAFNVEDPDPAAGEQ